MLAALLSGEYTAAPPPVESTETQLPLLLAFRPGGGIEIIVDRADELDTAFDVTIQQGTGSGSTSLPLLLSSGSSESSIQISVDIAVELDTAFDASVIDEPAVDFEAVVDLAIETDTAREVSGRDLLSTVTVDDSLLFLSEDESTLTLTVTEAESSSSDGGTYPSSSTYPSGETYPSEPSWSGVELLVVE